jgi:colanic acid/amylovoran biosynthesis protein
MHIQPVILHAQNTFNNGSFMMLINLIWYYVKHAPNQSRITFWVELDGEENYARLMDALPDRLLFGKQVEIKQLPLKITSIDNSSALRKAIRLFGKYFRHPVIFRKLGIDSVIILGGDDISEYYKKWMILSDLYRIYRYSRKFPTVLAGQTIGPFKGLREKMAAKCLSGTLIYTRDELSASYLKDHLNLPVKHIHQSADLCFPELPGQATASNILESYKLTPDHYITLVPGGFYKLYTGDREGYINSWVHLTKKLLEEDAYNKKQIVLLPHVTRPEDDRKMIRAIHLSLSAFGDHAERICMIGEELMPHQLRQILGNGHLTISSRMHAALSTFQMKKPAIALGYSVKYEGVIGRSVQCQQLVVNCSDRLLSDPEKFSFEVLRKTQYIEEHYEQLIAHLETRIPQLAAMAEDQIREICLAGKE